jgi:hypothetical protein
MMTTWKCSGVVRIVAVVVSLLQVAAPSRARGQVEAFRHDPARVPVGRVYEYIKSNRDGTNAGRVSLYVAGADRLESLKWAPGDTVATLVVATMDWARFSVRRLESWVLVRGAAPALRAALDTDSSGAGVRVSFAPDSLLPIRGWPWHSYDFDFASLNLSFPDLVQPEAPFTFQRADIVYAESWPPFADMGPVNVRFIRREQRSGLEVRAYQLDGPGLQDQMGRMWVSVQGAYVVEYEFPFPDEPGYTDVRLQLDRIRRATAAEWEELKRTRVSGRP